MFVSSWTKIIFLFLFPPCVPSVPRVPCKLFIFWFHRELLLVCFAWGKRSAAWWWHDVQRIHTHTHLGKHPCTHTRLWIMPPPWKCNRTAISLVKSLWVHLELGRVKVCVCGISDLSPHCCLWHPPSSRLLIQLLNSLSEICSSNILDKNRQDGTKVMEEAQ